MSTLPTIVDAMVAAGSSAEQIAAVVRAYEEARSFAEDARIAARRAGNAERQRRFRERGNAGNALQSVTERDECDAEPPVSPSSPSLSPRPPITTPPTPIIPPVEKAGASKRGTRLPEDWVLTDELLRDAIKAGMPEHLVSREAEIFRDFWRGKAGKDGVKLDWPATWRNWCRRTAEKLPRGQHAQQQRPHTPHPNEKSPDHLMASLARRARPGNTRPVEDERDDRSGADDGGTLLDFGPTGSGFSVR